jgi:ferredoxin
VPTLEFLANAIGRKKQVEAPAGGELVDICDDCLAPIPFSCRSASCGTCHVQVLEGAELLEPPSAEEAELLSVLGGKGVLRLACQARVRAGPGLIRLRPVLGADPSSLAPSPAKAMR